jgi:hypothetical protein
MSGSSLGKLRALQSVSVQRPPSTVGFMIPRDDTEPLQECGYEAVAVVTIPSLVGPPLLRSPEQERAGVDCGRWYAG